MDDSENVDTTQQVTSKVPITHVKNPKRVKAGKAIAEKVKLAREEQKKKMAEADVIVANEQLRKAQEEAKKVDESPPETAPPETTKVSQTLTTTQWLSVISIGISLLGIYYKREEIKNALSKIKAPASANAQTAPTSAPPAPESAPAVDKTPKKVSTAFQPHAC